MFSDAAGGANAQGGKPVRSVLRQLWSDERGQDIAEYAVMLAVILVIVVGTIRLIGSNANTVVGWKRYPVKPRLGGVTTFDDERVQPPQPNFFLS